MVKIKVLIVTLLCGLLAVVAPAYAQAIPAATVNPPAGPAGTRFSFLADGFRGNEKLDLWLNAPDGRVIATRPDAEAQRSAARNGRVAWSWTAPSDAQPGVWSLVARGQRSGYEVVGIFTVLAPAAPETAASGVQPASGAPGTRFAFFAAGFAAADPLAFYLTAPDGRERLSAVDPVRIANGRADWSWIAPPDAQLGVWRFRVVGGSSRFEQVITFTVASNRPTNVGVTPGVGRAGALFQFFAEGLNDREPVIFWVNRPDGRAEAVSVERVSVINGRADWSWLAPDDALPGQWSIVIRGTDSGVERLVPFEIR